MCYSYQVPKYLSKGIPFIVCVCLYVCAFVHSPVLSNSTECLLCIKHVQERTIADSREERGLEPNPRSEAVRLGPFPKDTCIHEDNGLEVMH